MGADARADPPALAAPLRWALALGLLAGVAGAAWWLSTDAALPRWISRVAVPALGVTYLSLIAAALWMGRRGARRAP